MLGPHFDLVPRNLVKSPIFNFISLNPSAKSISLSSLLSRSTAIFNPSSCLTPHKLYCHCSHSVTLLCRIDIMVDGNSIAYNVAAFISTLFLLEFGADKFVDHAAIIARRTGIPDSIIALLTAGAEWEEVGFTSP